MTATLDSRQTSHATTRLVPADPAEIAQARVFERLLQAERAELLELVQQTRQSADKPPGSGGSEPAGDLTEIRARLDEIHGLLRALQGRFPHAQPDLDR